MKITEFFVYKFAQLYQKGSNLAKLLCDMIYLTLIVIGVKSVKLWSASPCFAECFLVVFCYPDMENLYLALLVGQSVYQVVLPSIGWVKFFKRGPPLLHVSNQ